MTRKQSLVLKFSILWFGLVVIFIAYMMFGSSKNMSYKEQYLWMNVPIIYLVFMLPSLFYTITLGSFDRKIMPVMATYFTTLVYAIVSVSLIVIVTKTSMSVKVAILIQLVLLFIFAIELYVAFFTGSHIANVAAKEQQLLSRVTDIKRQAQILKGECKRIEKLGIQRECMSIMENLTFLSPVNNAGAFGLEENIIEELDSFSTLLSRHDREEELKDAMNRILSLYNRRKLMMN